MELMRGWIMGITGVSLITGIVMSLTPKGRVKKMAGLICGMAMITALISPVISFDYDSYAQFLTGNRYGLDAYTENLQTENERLTRRIIQEDVSAYILDKANSMGLEGLSVDVNTTLTNEGIWYPYEVWIEGDCGQSEMNVLGDYIEAECGIPPERQYWGKIDE